MVINYYSIIAVIHQSYFIGCYIISLKQFILILALIMLPLAMLAQSEGTKKRERLPYEGYVIAIDNKEPIRNTHVISKMAHCGTITNEKGRFHIQAKATDTLWVSCLGYSRRLIPIDSTMLGDTLVIRLHHDTITLREVTVLPFGDYETFKEMLITMPSIGVPDEMKRLEEDLDELWLSRVPVGNGKPTITANPIQFLYDKYNKSARRQARLLRNRRMYNEVLREHGYYDELLPDSLDYPIDYRIYELDEAAETGNPKALVPRKKYLRIGQ